MADILNDILLWSQVMSCFLKLVNVVATLLAMMPMMVKMSLSMLMVDGGGDEPDSVNGVVMVFITFLLMLVSVDGTFVGTGGDVKG